MDCLFCKIVAGEFGTEFRYEDDKIVAFDDISPQAPIHILVIPKEHISDVDSLADVDIAGRLTLVAAKLANDLGISNEGYRLVINQGQFGGQTVDHIHLHLIAGRQMGWPPG